MSTLSIHGTAINYDNYDNLSSGLAAAVKSGSITQAIADTNLARLYPTGATPTPAQTQSADLYKQVQAGTITHEDAVAQLNSAFPVDHTPTPVVQRDPLTGNSLSAPPGPAHEVNTTPKTTTKTPPPTTDEYIDPATGQKYVGGNGFTAQQVAAQNGVNVGAISPGQNQQNVNQVLQGVYQSRPDLQKVYRPDGSRINPNDGNPATLMDWAKTFGVNESPLIKQALNPPSPTPNTNTTLPPTTGTDNGAGAGGTVESKVKEVNPLKYVDDTYNKIYGELGIASVKQHYDDTNKQLLTLRNKVVDEKGAVNSNPWLTEGVRVAQNAKIDEKYSQKEANLIAYLTLSNNMYQQGLDQAQFLTNQVVGLESDTRAFDRQVALKQMDYAKADADARFTIAQGQPFYKHAGDPTVYSTATGKPLTYEQYIAEGGTGSFQDTYEIPTADQTASKTQILGLMASDPGAGILPTDDLATATAKYKAGAVYRKDTYIAPSAPHTEVVDLGNGQKQLIDSRTGAVINSYGSGTSGPSSYQLEGNQRIIQSVDNLLPQISGYTAGFNGVALSKIPGSSAYNFKAQLDTLKSNIAFGALTQMREASKTGGALGQISDAEERLLSSTLGALDPGQSPSVLTTQLQQIKDSITRWNDAASGSGNSTTSGAIPAGTDGATYGYPGYVSDGSQWVAK